MVLPYDNMDYGVDEVGARNITELTDVELTNLANDNVLKYNSTNLKWENQPDSAGGGSLDALTDTTFNSLLNGQFLQYNSGSSKWENSTLIFTDTDNLVDLTDTNISSVANNEILKYNSTSSKWENNNLSVNEIQDINITSLQNGEVLKYNSTSGKWENQDNTDTLNELTDVTLTGSTNNQVLKYNGSTFVNNFVNLTELADTNITSLNNGDILRYNSTSTKWETNTFNINDLDNVNITSVANNEILKYNSGSSKWENSNRIDTLDELGDVTLTSADLGDLLRYNGSNFVNTKIALDNDFTNVNFTSLTNGDLIKYNGADFINFAPTYLDGAGIPDNYLIKVVSGVTTRTTFIETSTLDVGTSLKTYIPTTSGLGILGGSIETEFFDTTKKRMHLTSGGIAATSGITITSDGRVGIGVVDPDEVLQIDGKLRIEGDNIQTLTFYDTHGGQTKEHARIEVDDDGGGADILFYTRPNGGNPPTEKLRINNDGAIGIGGANFGNSGQFLKSNASGSAVSWDTPIDTTYTNGTGVSISASNVISIGQSVGTSDNVAFNDIGCDSIDAPLINGSSGSWPTGRVEINGATNQTNHRISFWADVIQCHQSVPTSYMDLFLNYYGGSVYGSGNNLITSDARLKSNQRIVETATCQDIFDKIEVKQYERYETLATRLNGGDSVTRVGFIAQEVESALPDGWHGIVSSATPSFHDYSDDDPLKDLEGGIMHLDYSRLIVVLWGVVKRQQKTIAELNERVANL